MDTVKESFVSRLGEKGIALSEQQLRQFDTYYNELVEWNEKINLTAITEKDQVFLKHFYDSVSLAFYFPLQRVKTVADIGAGAGFPSLPLKIVFPYLQVTIIDSLQKRISFLQELVDKLGLTGVELIHGRAEDMARKTELRDRFDLVTARAVARLPVLNEFCLPFVRTGGHFAAMKGSDAAQEIADAARSLKELKGKVEHDYRFELPDEKSERHIIIIRKADATPNKYPRKAGVPLKQPLV